MHITGVSHLPFHQEQPKLPFGLLKQKTKIVLLASWDTSSLLTDTSGHTEELLFVPSLQQLVHTTALILTLSFLVILSPNLLASIISQTTSVLLPLQVIFPFVQEAC